MADVAAIPLHCHSHYSLMRGVGSPTALVERAAALGYPALALTDRDALYGAVRFQQACRAHGLKPIFGVELTIEPASTDLDIAHVTLLATNRMGYGNLCRLVSRARLACEKGEARLPAGLLAEHSDGLICLSGPATGEVPRLLRAGRRRDAARAAAHYRELFGDRFYLEVQAHGLPDERWLAAELADLGRRLRIPLVASTDVHYPSPDDRPLHDVVTCIRTKTTLSAPSPERLPNGRFSLLPPAAFARPFGRRYPEALANTLAIVERCEVAFDAADARFPTLPLPPGRTPDEELRRLCDQGARRRYGEISKRVRDQLDHELSLIAQRGLAPIFLIAADIARRFRGRCRGSAAGSLVVYCLGVSVVDPLRYDMLFERFINPERESPADIDIDFSEAERERAIAYCYETYGAERTAMVCNYVRFRARSAVRDVGKVLGMPADLIDRLAKSLDHLADVDTLAGNVDRVTRRTPGAPQPWSLLTRFCRELDGAPRHLSIHVGGMLITGRPLAELVGLEPARKEGIVVVGADKEDVEDLGLSKLDLLCLRALSVVQECAELERARGIPLDLAALHPEDPRVYAAMSRADTIGASQVESRAQMQSVVRTQPRTFADLMAQVAIIRPGPITGGLVQAYYRRRSGAENVRYLHPCLEPILKDTLGVFLYQEQILLAVSALTGCSAGDADQFRRAMGSQRSRQAMERLRPWFLEHALANGIPSAVAAAAFQQIAGFASFGFCKSHAGALARLAYETMYLKLYHAPAFTAALLNNQPMGFYPVEVLVWDARRHGVEFRPVDLERSGARCTLEGDAPAVRLGFAQVKGVGAAAGERIVAERTANGPYRTLNDFCRRTELTGRAVESLILAGAFDGFGHPREELLWEFYGLRVEGRQAEFLVPEEPAAFPARTAHEQTLIDYAVLGISLDYHLVDHYRRRLAGLRVVPTEQVAACPDGQQLRVGGLVVCRQAPETAKGFVFMTLEDAHGLVNVIIRPDIYARYRPVLRDHALVAVAGRVQRNQDMINVIAERAIGLNLATPDTELPDRRSRFAGAPTIRSHDFH